MNPATWQSANLSGDTLALAVLDRCVLHKTAQIDMHMTAQNNFLLDPEPRGSLTVTPRLAYVGHVETIATDWPALVSKFFGADAAIRVGEDLRSGELHHRNRNDVAYSNTTFAKYNLRIQFPIANATIERAYFVDKVCLGY